MILEAKTSPPLVSSHYPKLILRGKVYLSPPPLHWVVAPAFNICSDYSRSRNLMFSPRVGIKKTTFFIFEKSGFLDVFFVPRRFSLQVSSKLKSPKMTISTFLYNSPSILMFFFLKKKQFWVLSTQNCSGKLNNLVAPTHLELRSPMFGEFCISFFLGEFQWN